jgi:hypothetical protein
MCGKEFQNQDDLVRHRQFEKGEEQNKNAGTNENKGHSRLNRNSGSVNEARNKELASRLANLLEGLETPSTKSRIIDHMREQIQGNTADVTYGNDKGILWVINNLSSNDRIPYNRVNEIEKAAGLVTEKVINPK